MPKKAEKETQAEQSARFEAEVERLIEAGELNPTEADEAFRKLLGRVVTGDREDSPPRR